MNFDTHNDSVTYQEIVRQQSGWKVVFENFDLDKQKYVDLLTKYSDRVWVFSGCGTSYYLAQTASYIFEEVTGLRCTSVPASEILMFPEIIFNKNEDYLLIPISRSGTTTEIVKAAQKVRTELNIPTLALSCDPDSTLIIESIHKLTFPFEQEKSVVMTGSFTTMLFSILQLASLISDNQDITNKMNTLSDTSRTIMKDYEPLMREIASNRHLQDYIFLGQGPLFGIASEAALKMQEMTITISQSFHSLEYRHGPMSTTTENSLITLLTSNSGENFEAPLVDDLKKLGAKILVFTPEGNNSLYRQADYLVKVPDEFEDIFYPFLYIPVLQLLAHYRAISKNINPDNPKNLSAVVKLEI